MSKRWMENIKKRETKKRPLHASRSEAAIAVATRWLAEAGFHEGESSGDIEYVGWDIVDGQIVARFALRVGAVDIDKEMEKTE